MTVPARSSGDPTPVAAPAAVPAPRLDPDPVSAPGSDSDRVSDFEPVSDPTVSAIPSGAASAAPAGATGAARGRDSQAVDASVPPPAAAEHAAAFAPAGAPGGSGDAPDGPEGASDVSADETTATPPPGLWDRMRADPQYAPEHLALEAVRRLGPQTRRWVEQIRATYPGIDPESVARLAIGRFVNRARLSGAVSGATGLPGAVADVGVLAWTQARMVLHLAAAYGHDPEHEDRATDLLVLQKVHKVAHTARLALGVAAGRERAGALFAGSNAPVGRVMLRLGVRLAQMAGIRAAKRVFAKVVPGAAIILGTWANSAATKDLARRAVALYRPGVYPPRPEGHPNPSQARP